MRLLKKTFATLLTVLLLGILALIVWLQYPVQDPSFPASHFAPRPAMKNLPKITMKVFETGYSPAPEAYVKRGGSLLQLARLTHSAVVLEHPKGKVILDSGFGKSFYEQVQHASWDHRLLDPITFIPTRPLAEQSGFPELNPARDFFLISHAHFDHLSGTGDFPRIPVKMLAEEAKFATGPDGVPRHGIFAEQVAAIRDRIVPLQLKDTPYENFPQSLDLFGDGSIVLVSLAGHTPGSMGVFVNLPTGERFLFVGDALWTTNDQGQPEARSPVAEFTSDFDKDQARLVRLKLAELIAHSNEVTLVPIHDSRALAKVQRLSSPNL